jgi:two-component system, OmpR family, sensor kinase
MKLSTRILISQSLLFSIAAAGASMPLLTVLRSEATFDSADLAHRIHSHYLSASFDTYQLLTEFSDSVEQPRQESQWNHVALANSIRSDFASISRYIVREAEIVGQGEIDELRALRESSRIVENLLGSIAAVQQQRDAGATAEALRTQLVRVRAEFMQSGFNRVIRAAIDEEAREVEQSRIEVERLLARTRVITFGFISLATILFLLTVTMMIRQTARPLRSLQRASTAIIEHRPVPHIDESGPIELRDLAQSFNIMNTEISNRQAALTELNSNLEKAVAQRTAELVKAIDAMKGVDARRRQLLADVSHELRTPLTIIRGEADVTLRQKGLHVEDYRRSLEHTRSSAEHCALLVEDLLFIARQEAGATILRFEKVNLVELLLAVIDECAALASDAGATIAFRRTVTRATVDADPLRLRQLIMILLKNAIRYGGNRITVDIELRAAGFAVSVSDNGPGMSEHEREHAFERFYRGSNASKRYEHGSGLGLPLAKSIVDAHHGQITLRNEPRHGVTVTFTLPAQSSQRISA